MLPFSQVLLEAGLARRAVLARVDHAAHGGEVALAELRDGGTHFDDAADDLVAGHDWIDRVLPLVAHLVQVRVTDTAIQDLDHHIVGERLATFDRHRRDG